MELSGQPPRSQTRPAAILAVLVSVYDLKPRFVALLTPLVDLCARRGVTPNGLTLLALVLSIAGGGVLWFFPAAPAALAGAGLVLLVRMALNAMDGALARRTGQSSRSGEVFNEMGDVVADAALYAPLLVVSTAFRLLLFAFVLLTGWSELAGVLPKVAGGARRYDGPLGKSDRALVVGVYFVALAAGVPHGMWENVLFGLATVLLGVTIANRLRRGLKGLDDRKDAA